MVCLEDVPQQPEKGVLYPTFGEEATLNGAGGLAQEMGSVQRQDSIQAGLCVECRILHLSLVKASAMGCRGHCDLWFECKCLT